MMNRTLLLMGPPGAGKGEQAKRIASVSGMTHVAMGSLIRHYCDIPREGNICEVIEQNYKAGIPQSDVLVFKILRDYLGTIDTSKGVIFDAFPLSVGEAETVPAILDEFGLDQPIVIHIDCDEETAVRRITLRKICSHCGRTFTPGTVPYENNVCDACGNALIQREDDREEIVRARYKEYEQRIRSLLEYYGRKKYPVVTYVTGKDSPETDFQILKEKLHDIGIVL